ncbi:MAG: helix-turn-helix transcriptional regulator [Cyclobacteriaceae bacterium]
MAKKKLNRIKAVLADLEITSTQLAVALGKNTVSVSRWCTNESQPSLETLFDIADFLKVDVAELLVRK